MVKALSDAAGVDCCCNPAILDECPPNTSGCPSMLSMSMSNHIVQSGECVKRHSFQIPVLEPFSPNAPLWNVSGGIPVPGTNCIQWGTWQTVVVSGPPSCTSSSGGICSGFGCGPACVQPFDSIFITCANTDPPTWDAFFSNVFFALVWRSQLTTCPGPGPWIGESGGPNIISHGTLTVT